jgi:hypothetical protein
MAEQRVVEAEAELARSRRQAEQAVVTAEAEARSRSLAGKGEGMKVMQVGLAEAAALLQKIQSFGDPRLYALSVVAEHLSHSSQPLVPERLFVTGGAENGSAGTPQGMGLVGTLLQMLVAEKSGFAMAGQGNESPKLRELVDRISSQALENMQQASMSDIGTAVAPKSATVGADVASTPRLPVPEKGNGN